MSQWVERLEDRAFARIGAQGEAELSSVAHRVGTSMVGTIRVLAIAAAVVLMLQAGTGPIVVVAAAGALAWVVLSVAYELRLDPDACRERAGLSTLGDNVPLMIAMALAGGADGPLRLLIVPLPIVLGLVGAERVVLLGTLCTFAGYAAVGATPVQLGALGIQLAWAAAVGVAVARQRRRSLARLTAVDELRRSLITGDRTRRPSEVGHEVREAALGPLEQILNTLRVADRPALEGLATAVADVARRLRSIVVELHVLTARQGGLRGSLEGLAQRRSPAAELTLETPDELDDEQVLLVTSLAREALRAVAGEQTRHVALRVAREQSSLSVQVEALPAPVDADAEARGELFLAHAATAGATAAHLAGGSARAVVEEREPEPAPSWIPGRSLQDARLLILLLRVPSIVAVLAAGAVAGATDPRLYLVGALMLVWSPMVLRAVTVRTGTLRRYLLVATPDLAGVIALAALLGDAREALLPLVIAVPPCYGLLLSVPVTTGIVILFLTGFVATGLGSTAFVVAFTWSGAIAVLLSGGTTALDRSLVRNARNRRALVRALAHEAEDERRRIAERLHDETLQLLLAARQDLEEAADGAEGLQDTAADAIAAAVASLQTAAVELDADADALPDGPRDALRALADTVADRGGPVVRLDVEAAAVGHHDGLIVRLAGELVANAMTHAEADHLLVRLACRDQEVLLEVTDDGRGIDLARVRDAVERGHVGLASCRERVQGSGGRMELSPGPQGGTRVLVSLPARLSSNGVARG